MAEAKTSVWECRVCVDQMFGAPRCSEHNPTPEERETQRSSSADPWWFIGQRVKQSNSADVSRPRKNEQPQEAEYAF